MSYYMLAVLGHTLLFQIPEVDRPVLHKRLVTVLGMIFFLSEFV